jgi:hypothetical protein
MRLPTYTGIMRLQYQISQVGKVPLPGSYSVLQIVAAAGSAMFLLSFGSKALALVGLGLTPGNIWFYAAVPLGVLWLAGRPVADRKPVHVWLASQFLYLLEPRVLIGLRRGHQPRRYRLRITVWQPMPAKRAFRGTRPAPRTQPQVHELDAVSMLRFEPRGRDER